MSAESEKRLLAISREIERLEAKIETLKEESDGLIKEQLTDESLSISERFDIWCDSPNRGGGNDDGWYPMNNKCPIALSYFADKCELQRHRVYNVIDLIYEYLGGVCEEVDEDGDCICDEDEDEDYERIPLDKFEAIALELMNANIDEFTYDW